MKHGFEYFLNAIHYFIYLEEVWSNSRMDKFISRLFYLMFKIPFIGKYIQKLVNRHTKEVQEMIHGKKSGLSISVAHHWFGYFYSGYSCFFYFVLVGIADKYFGHLNTVAVVLLSAIPIGSFYVPAYKAVFSNDKYLKYFMQFDKEDECWHRKWKWITIAFCMGSVVFTLAGIFAMWGVGKILSMPVMQRVLGQ